MISYPIWTSDAITKPLAPEQIFPGNPPLRAVDIYSKPINLPLTNTLHVVCFMNKNSGSVIKNWVNLLNWSTLQDKSIQFTNILFPGGIFFMIPRSRALNKIRNLLEIEIEAFQANWSSSEKLDYKKLKIHWVVDFKRQLFKKYGLNAKYSSLFLINKDGQLLDQARQDNPDDLNNFLKTLTVEVEKMKNK